MPRRRARSVDERIEEAVGPVIPVRQPEQIAAERLAGVAGDQPRLLRITGEAVGPPAAEHAVGHGRHVRVVVGMGGDGELVAGAQLRVIDLRIELLEAHGRQLTTRPANPATE